MNRKATSKFNILGKPQPGMDHLYPVIKGGSTVMNNFNMTILVYSIHAKKDKHNNYKTLPYYTSLR